MKEKWADIKINKQVVEDERKWLKYIAVDEKRSLMRIRYHEQQIRDKIWLHYLKTGRLIE